jgi:hypothetical protein
MKLGREATDHEEWKAFQLADPWAIGRAWGPDTPESALNPQGEIEALVCLGTSRFEQEAMGQGGPMATQAHLIGGPRSATPPPPDGRRLPAGTRAAYSTVSNYNLFQPSADAQQFGAALARWRRRHGRQPDCADVLAVARQLGWRKGVAPQGAR